VLDAHDASERAHGATRVVSLRVIEHLPHDPAHIVSTSIGPSGELIVATTTADPIATHGVRHLDPTLGGPGRLPGPAPYPLEIHTHGASRPVVRVEQVDLAAPTVQPVPGGGYLLVGARARWHGEWAEPNAVALDANGHHLRSFCIGDGVAHVQVSEAGAIWVGYTDEGVYGNSGWGPPDGPAPLGAGGLVNWTLEGRKDWVFRGSDVAPPIDDCYAMNLDGESVWASYYSDFPVVHVAPGGDIAPWPSLGSGGRALLVGDGRVGIAGGYRELADRLAVADLSGGARRALRIVLPDGSPLPPAAELMARGSALHTVIGGVWLSLDLDEVT
jgi:hypothetical protein